MSRTWNGPISLAVFAPDIEFELTAKFLQVILCQINIFLLQLTQNMMTDFFQICEDLYLARVIKQPIFRIPNLQ